MGNSASALPYSIGKQVTTVNNGWALHEGTQKSDGATVSVFVAKKPALSKTQLTKSHAIGTSNAIMQIGPARHHFINCKKLRHPHILKVFATLDTDNPNDANSTGVTANTATKATTETGDMIIVTEPCSKLDDWLQSNPPLEVVAWGLESIVRALSFLHGSAHLAHCNVSPESFMVTPSGDVKLWNFSLTTSIQQTENDCGLPRHFLDWEAQLTPEIYRSPERIEGRWDAIAASPVHVMDSYSVGVLISHFFNHQIPTPLIKAVQRMQTPNLKMRPRLQPLLKCPIFDTPYQKLQLQLEEFTVQPVEQKTSFWQTVTPQMTVGLISQTVAVHKLLPLIKSSAMTIGQSDSLKAQDMYRRELSSMLPPMFYIAENYLQSVDDFRREILPVAKLLFTVTDRGIRGQLLQKMSLFVKHMDKHEINTTVFEPMCSGFSDSSAALRELTLKATLLLLPILTHPNLEKLARYLIRLQSDPEPSIRTNTIIFFSKLAPHLSEMSRQKQLMPAFTRAMRDSFPACRLSALKSVRLVKEYFTPQELARTVVPAVAQHLLDDVADVRREGFLVMDDFLATIRQESERLASLSEMNSSPAGLAVPSTASTSTTTGVASTSVATKPISSASGGYLSGLSSWMSTATAVSPAATATTYSESPIAAPTAPVASTSVSTTTATMLSVEDDMDGSNIKDDGWGDIDDVNAYDDANHGNESYFKATSTMTSTNNALPATRPSTDDISFHNHNIDNGVSRGAVTATHAPLNSQFASMRAQDDDEDNFFGSFQNKTAKPVANKLKSATISKGKLIVPSKKPTTAAPKPIIKKLEVKDDGNDGWDDF